MHEGRSMVEINMRNIRHAVGLALLILFSEAAAHAQMRVDDLMTLTNVQSGTQVSASSLSAGTLGTATSWSQSSGSLSAMTVGPHQSKCSVGTAIVAGNSISNPSSQPFAYNNSSNFTYWTRTIPSGHRKVAFGVCVTMNSIPSISNLYDMIVVFDPQGHYVAFQLRSQNCINIETDGNGTLHSGCITGQAGASYWCTFLDDETGGTASLACHDPTTGAQVGSTVTVNQQTGRDVTSFRLGNNEIGTASTTTYFENLAVDYSNGVFPMLNSAAVKPNAPTGLSLIIQ
jgi:hypothetical protein